MISVSKGDYFFPKMELMPIYSKNLKTYQIVLKTFYQDQDKNILSKTVY